ncbi:hypothetical protein GCM10022291_02290 [Postechiella marina]|uniref:Uncharacterized protein n=1 Tax=Postechiella marina TaxID=943941 RepID=A0ABP8BZU8_9FLAO
MDNKEFAKKLEFRTRQFGISIIKLSSSLPNSIEAKELLALFTSISNKL